jgi:hypothetical protein
MKTIWIVYLYIHTPADTAQTRWEGGTEKPYAVFSNKKQAEEVRDLLLKMGKEQLVKLKIIKPEWDLNTVIVSHPFAVDNYENIIKKLSS